MRCRRTDTQATVGPRNSGFTLIELLIVIAIIASLMALSVAVMFGLTDQARQEATITTIRKIDAILQQRMEGFDRAFTGNRKLQDVNATKALLAGQNIFGVRNEVVDILARKAAFRFDFPQRMEERYLFGDPATFVITPTPMPDSLYRKIAFPRARQQLIAEGNPSPTPALVDARVLLNWARHNPQTASSALLHFTLIMGGTFGASSADADRFTSQEIADTDGDGLPEFIDAWGQPLRYYRWPTRLMDVDPPAPFQPDLTNPADPTDVIVVVAGTPVGVREVNMNERQVASLLLKGLPPASTVLPGNNLPRDLMLTDPDDPVGRLYAELERLDGMDGRPLFRTEFNEAKYHTPDTYHVPLIISPGKDGLLGLFEPGDTANFGNLAAYDSSVTLATMIDQISDNICNRNRRAGGRR